MQGGENGGLVNHGEATEVWQVAIFFGVVEAVADDELVGDGEASEAGADIADAAIGFVEQASELDAGGAALGEVVGDGPEGAAGVDDVLDYEDMAAGEIGVDIFAEVEFASGAALAVAGDGDEFHFHREVEAANEVGVEHDRALEDSDHERVFIGVCCGDLSGEGVDAGEELLLCQHDLDRGGVEVIRHLVPFEWFLSCH